jgi:hypothetical protein
VALESAPVLAVSGEGTFVALLQETRPKEREVANRRTVVRIGMICLKLKDLKMDRLKF